MDRVSSTLLRLWSSGIVFVFSPPEAEANNLECPTQLWNVVFKQLSEEEQLAHQSGAPFTDVLPTWQYQCFGRRGLRFPSAPSRLIISIMRLWILSSREKFWKSLFHQANVSAA
ncbi:uncharacterized protein ACNLHF_010889 [Anomaloglossus baeobatrachus]